MADNKVEIKVTADASQATAGLNAVKQELGTVGQKGSATADQIDAAWAILGTKSFAQVKSEVARVNAALEVVKATTKNPLEIKAATEAARVKIQSLEDGVKKTTQAAGGLSEVFGKLGPIIGAAFTGREFAQTVVAAESLKLGLAAILGSSQAAAAEMAFLKKTSNELGLELQSAGQQYLSLTAATKGTALEGEQTRQVFTAVSRAMSILGKSGVETERALAAISQMASKGTVAMEELRGQLGEALPGALKAAADGAGITTSQLIKMVENGDVLAKDLLPALAKGLNAVYANGGSPDTLIANWNRLKNSITETSTTLGESGLTRALTDAAIVGTQTVGALGSAFVGLGKGIGNVAGAVATMNFKPLIDDLGLAQRSGKEFEEVMYDAAGNVIGVVEKLPPALGSTGKAAEAAGDKGKEAFRKMEIAAQNTGDSILKTRGLYTEREEAAKRYVDVAEKGVKAAEAEAKVINLVANAFGSETEKRQASALASKLQEDAQNQLLLVKRVELDIAQQKLAQLNNETRGVQELDEATKKQKESLEQSVKVKTEEVRATQAQGKAYELATSQSKALAEASKDNSSRIYELRAAMVAATEAAAKKREELAKGKATQEQVTAADLAAANANFLYRDALNDLVTKLKLKETALGQQNVTQQKENDLNLEAKTTTLELAKARGDDAAATKAQTELTQASVQAKRDSANALRTEAQAARETADAEEAAAKSSGNLTTEKKAQIESLREAAKQKELDAQKTDLLANREEQLAKAVESTTSALERKNAAQERSNAALEKAAELERKRLGVDKQGFSTDKDGNRITQLVQTQRSVYENAKGQGLDEAQALQISNQFIQNGKQVGASGANVNAGENWGTELQKAIDQVVLANAAKKGSEAMPTMGTAPAPGPAPTANTYLVKVEFPGGQSGSFNAASDNDARSAAQLLKTLAQHKMAAGY